MSSQASALQAAGAQSAVLGSAEAGANTSRAAVIHARTLEVLESTGATDNLLAAGVVAPVFTVQDRSKS